MSSRNEHVVALIERAAKHLGSEAKLARALGLDPTTLGSMKAGRRPCVPEMRALIAGYAREDAVQELVRATLEKTEGTPRGEQLRVLLGKALRPIGAAAASVLLALGSLTFWPTPATAKTVLRELDTMIGKVKRRRRLASV